jgi:hypothetical protein
MPTIPLGPNYQSFSDVAHQLELEREANLQLALQRDRMNADVENQRAELVQRQSSNVFNQQKGEQDQALQMFRAETDRNMRQMEQDRLQQAQEDQYNANNFKRAVETGVMMDEGGQKYVPVTQEEQPELYKAREDWLKQKNLADTRLREDAKQRAAEYVSTQQLAYLKAGLKLELTADDAGNPRILSHPLNAQDPEWGWWQEQQRMAEDKILTPEERIKIEEAKAGLKQPEVDAKAQERADREYNALRDDVRSEEKALRSMEKDLVKSLPNLDAVNAAKDHLDQMVADAGKNPSKKEAQAISSQKVIIKGMENDLDKYETQKGEVEEQRKYVTELKRQRDVAGAKARRIPGETGAATVTEAPVIPLKDFLTKTEADENTPGVARFWDIVLNQRKAKDPEATAAWSQMSKEQRLKVARALASMQGG